jgi:ABC-type multidrug transport system fused ATPase/permease subunit
MAWVLGMVMRRISRRLFSVVQWQDPGFYQRMQTGDIISRMTNDLGQIQFALTGAIARAIIRNPALLLLDEATSALDPATEAAVSGTLHRAGRGRLTIHVTHRLAAASTTHQIYVLNRGYLVEQGTYAEPIRRGGRHAWMWQQQSGSSRDSLSTAVTEPIAT